MKVKISDAAPPRPAMQKWRDAVASRPPPRPTRENAYLKVMKPNIQVLYKYFKSTGNFTPDEIKDILTIFNDMEEDISVSEIYKMKGKDELEKLGFSPEQSAKIRVRFIRAILNRPDMGRRETTKAVSKEVKEERQLADAKWVATMKDVKRLITDDDESGEGMKEQSAAAAAAAAAASDPQTAIGGGKKSKRKKYKKKKSKKRKQSKRKKSKRKKRKSTKRKKTKSR
jgi:hypothetical protein